MIVEERFENYVNIYVDGYVFTADADRRVWEFGDGLDNEERRANEASRRAMTKDEFVNHYHSICNAAAGWEDERWTYRYNTAALNSQGTLMQEEVVNRVEQAIDRNGVSQDREKCQDMLKKYASLGMIRQNGLCIRKYIYDKNGKGQGRIVYRMDELSPSDVEALIPKQVLFDTLHRKRQG